MIGDDDALKTQAIEKLEQLAALSGWPAALDALDTIYEVDAIMAVEGETLH